MEILRVLDPDGVAQRAKRRLRRRIYYSKVITIFFILVRYLFNYRVPTTSGTLMPTKNLFTMGLLFMDALMG